MKVLQDEAEKIYYAIFRKKVPVVIKTHFGNLSRKIEENFTEIEINNYRKYVQKNLDLEALEVAARHLNQLPLLTAKLNSMIYLAEAARENYSIYVNEKDCFVMAYLSLISFVFRGLYKFLKGTIILVIYKS